MDYYLLKTFCTVARIRNITKAGELLGYTRPALSRRISLLEEQLNVTLIERYPTGILLTEEGETFLEHAEKIVAEIEIAMSSIKTLQDTEQGVIKIMENGLGANWLSTYAKEFKDLYPGITLKMARDNKSLLYPSFNSGVFVGLTTMEPPEDTPYIWHKIGTYRWYPYAHPSYLEQYGTPEDFKALDHHLLIGYQWATEYSYLGDKKSNPLLYAGRENTSPRSPAFFTDDTIGCKRLIEEGCGIGLISRFLTKGTPLQQVLVDLYDPTSALSLNAYFVYPPYLRKHRRVNILKDFIIEKAAQDLNY